MSTNEEFLSILSFLCKIAKDEMGIERIFAIPKEQFPPEYKSTQWKISNHFAADNEVNNTDHLMRRHLTEPTCYRSPGISMLDNGGDTTGALRRKHQKDPSSNKLYDEQSDDEEPLQKRHRSGSSSTQLFVPHKERSPFRRFLRMHILTLDPSIQQHLETHGTNPNLFLSDTEVLNHPLNHPTNSISDAFIACYNFTRAVTRRTAKNLLRWHFAMMFHFDLVKIIRPDSYNGKMGHLMYDELKQFLQPLEGTPGFQRDTVLVDVQRWSLVGSKLVQLRNELGAGCFFYLPNLSEDFIKAKFTRKGNRYDEAMRHLKNLGIKEEAERSGAAKLGQNISEALISPFLKLRREQIKSEGQA